MTLSINKVQNQAIANKSEGTELVHGTGSAVFKRKALKRGASLFQNMDSILIMEKQSHVNVCVCAATIVWGMSRGTVKRPAAQHASSNVMFFGSDFKSRPWLPLQSYDTYLDSCKGLRCLGRLHLYGCR